MHINTLTNTFKPYLARPLVRQLLGGVAGALIALVMYNIYTFAEGAVKGMLIDSDTETSETWSDEARAANLKRIGEKAREAAERGE